MSENSVLIVDDEPHFLSQFEAYLVAKGFGVITAAGAPEAISSLSGGRVAVIVADQRMPGTKGVELLSQVQQEYPDVIRVLITGYSDTEVIAEGVNRGEIYRYISKKALPDEIASVVSQSLEKYRQDAEIKKLYRANRRLMRILAAQQNLSAFGIFGREVARKVEEIVLGLSGYLFSAAGSNNTQSLEMKFKHLEASLQRIRELSTIVEEVDSPVVPISLLQVIEEESDRLQQVLSKQGGHLQMMLRMEGVLPPVLLPASICRRIFKEIFENAILFSPSHLKKIVVRGKYVADREDPHLRVEITNPVLADTPGSHPGPEWFAPFYTTLGGVDFEGLEGIPPVKEYNLGKGGHYGLGLSIARWLMSREGGEVTLDGNQQEVRTLLVFPVLS